MTIIDIHSHLADHYFDTSRDAVLARMNEKAVATITIGTDLATSRAATKLSSVRELVWASVGIHPDEITDTSETDLASLETLLSQPRVVAVGECGLDYFRADDQVAARALQQPLFEMQIELAAKHNLPLMLHVRPSRGTLDAYEETLDILARYAQQYPELRGNSHFFAGDVAIARKFFDIGFTISFTGVITFAHDYDAVIEYAPLDMIHAETDAPFVAPKPYRGTQCEPWMVEEVVSRISAIKKIDDEVVKRQLYTNAQRYIGLAYSR